MYRIKSKVSQKWQCLKWLLLFLFYQQIFSVASVCGATHYRAGHFLHRARRHTFERRMYLRVAQRCLSHTSLTTLLISGILRTCAKQHAYLSEITWSQGVPQRATSTSSMNFGRARLITMCLRSGFLFPQQTPVPCVCWLHWYAEGASRYAVTYGFAFAQVLFFWGFFLPYKGNSTSNFGGSLNFREYLLMCNTMLFQTLKIIKC